MAARGPSPQLDALGRSLALRHVLVSAMPPTGSRPSGGAPAGLHEQASSMDRDIGERHVSSSTTRPFSATKRMCVPQAHRRFQDCLVLVAMPLPVRFAARRDRARHGRDKGRQLRRCRWSARAAYGNCREGNSPERSCSSPAFALAKGASSRTTGIRTQLARGRRLCSCTTLLELAASARDVQPDLFSEFGAAVTAPEADFVRRPLLTDGCPCLCHPPSRGRCTVEFDPLRLKKIARDTCPANRRIDHRSEK